MPAASPIPLRPLRRLFIAVLTVVMLPAGMSPALFTHVVATPGKYIRPFFCDRVAEQDFLINRATLGGSTSVAETVPVLGCPATLATKPEMPLRLSRSMKCAPANAVVGIMQGATLSCHMAMNLDATAATAAFLDSMTSSTEMSTMHAPGRVLAIRNIALNRMMVGATMRTGLPSLLVCPILPCSKRCNTTVTKAGGLYHGCQEAVVLLVVRCSTAVAVAVLAVVVLSAPTIKPDAQQRQGNANEAALDGAHPPGPPHTAP